MIDVVRFESRLLSSDRTFRWTAAVFTAAVAYALTHGMVERTAQRESIERVRAEHQSKWKTHQGEAQTRESELRKAGESLDDYKWGPRSPATVGMSYGAKILADAPALSALAVGQRDLYPAAHRVLASKSIALQGGEAFENPLALAAGHFDLTFVMLYLVPLLAIALAYDLTASERETGMLRMLLAQPVSISTLVAGKLTVRAAVLCALVTVASLVGFVIAGESNLVRFALWTTTALLYCGFWFALALVVNARGGSAPLNAVILAAGWLVFVALIPALVNLAASSLYPVPSRPSFVAEMRSQSAVIQKAEQSALETFITDHPELAESVEGGPDWAMKMLIRDELTREELKPVLERYTVQRDRQQALVGRLSYLSPTLLAHRLLLDVAGTGSSQQRAHLADVENFQKVWHAHFLPLVFEKKAFRPADYDRVPRFQDGEEPLRAVAERSSAALAVLMLLVVFAGAIGFRLYTRYPVTHTLPN